MPRQTIHSQPLGHGSYDSKLRSGLRGFDPGQHVLHTDVDEPFDPLFDGWPLPNLVFGQPVKLSPLSAAMWWASESAARGR